jgi:hypothetical protein
MGLSSWLTKLIAGDPEERKIRRELKAEAKKAKQEAFKNQYRISLLEEAGKRGKAKAIALAQHKGQSGGGILNTLGRIGENMNAASKGLVDGIGIDPSGGSSGKKGLPFIIKDPFEAEDEE